MSGRELGADDSPVGNGTGLSRVVYVFAGAAASGGIPGQGPSITVGKLPIPAGGVEKNRCPRPLFLGQSFFICPV